MGIRAWPHGWIADRRSIKREQRIFSESQIVERGQFHDEVMRMLAVIDRLAERRFTLLEQKRVEALRHGCRLQTEHGPKCEFAPANLSLCHGHEPVGGKNFVITPWAALLQRV